MKRFLKWTAIAFAVLMVLVIVAAVLEPTMFTQPRPPGLPQ
jgi:hypothetical protein